MFTVFADALIASIVGVVMVGEFEVKNGEVNEFQAVVPSPILILCKESDSIPSSPLSKTGLFVDQLLVVSYLSCTFTAI